MTRKTRDTMTFIQRLLHFFTGRRIKPTPIHANIWQPIWSKFLLARVSFYRNLTADERVLFEKRVLLFLHSTAIEGGVAVTVTDEDKLLVAASAIIPVWSFPKWHYFNLKAVYLLPAAFDTNFICGGPQARITGMVGTGAMAGKLALSKPHLHLGFANHKDKENVGIHEFVHLIDMADGQSDGFPEKLKPYAFALPWFEFVQQKIAEIDANKSNIRDYGATNPAEFFSVASEYFFERPRLLERKHPKLYAALENFYQLNAQEIEQTQSSSKNGPCPCGSTKKYKRCCMALL